MGWHLAAERVLPGLEGSLAVGRMVGLDFENQGADCEDKSMCLI